jgi:hypothetical protein
MCLVDRQTQPLNAVLASKQQGTASEPPMMLLAVSAILPAGRSICHWPRIATIAAGAAYIVSGRWSLRRRARSIAEQRCHALALQSWDRPSPATSDASDLQKAGGSSHGCCNKQRRSWATTMIARFFSTGAVALFKTFPPLPLGLDSRPINLSCGKEFGSVGLRLFFFWKTPDATTVSFLPPCLPRSLAQIALQKGSPPPAH